MHARELVEIGALVASHGTALTRFPAAEINQHVESYWSASKCRTERWMFALKDYHDAQRADEEEQQRWAWGSVRPVLEEVLLSELLTRIWTAAICGMESARGSRDVEPLVRNVLDGHLEARIRVLNVIVYGKTINIEEALHLNRFRRRVERWTDMLLGYLSDHCDAASFGFNAQRVRDFSTDIRETRTAEQESCGWQLIQASIRSAFQESLTCITPNADLNQAIAAAVLSSLGHDFFDSVGLPRGNWLVRIAQTTSDCQGMIDELLTLENPTRRF